MNKFYEELYSTNNAYTAQNIAVKLKRINNYICKFNESATIETQKKNGIINMVFNKYLGFIDKHPELNIPKPDNYVPDYISIENDTFYIKCYFVDDIRLIEIPFKVINNTDN